LNLPNEPVYKSAEELGITECERRELIESIPYFLALDPAEFSMMHWDKCIWGHIARLNGRDPKRKCKPIGAPLRQLYCVDGRVWKDILISVWAAKPVDAARAIVAFLSA
jgi:hypothetical protein